MNIADIFLEILTVISDSITALLSMLPNPDPFPAILEDLSIESSDALSIAYYWIDQFCYADLVFTFISIWFLMFPIAWVIMMLWKWLKAR